MKWKKFTLITTTAAEDLISSMFDEIGIEGVEIEDNIPLTDKETKGMFIDILPELPPAERPYKALSAARPCRQIRASSPRAESCETAPFSLPSSS